MELPLHGLSVLLLEDSERDIEIIYQKLADDFNCPVEMDTAETEARFVSLIKAKKYDLIMADYTMPGYNGPAALRQALALCPDIPFICVSGTIGEDTAVEMLKQGATDYVIKDRLDRLSFAIIRALEGAKNEREKTRAEYQLKRTVENLEEAQRIAHVGSAEWDAVNDVIVLSDETYRIHGLDPQKTKLHRRIIFDWMDETDQPRVAVIIDSALKEIEPIDVQYWINRPDGEKRFIHFHAKVKSDAQGRLSSVVGTMQDITDQKLAEQEIRKVKENLEEAQRIAHIGSSEWDIKNNKVYWSDEAYRILGLDPKNTEISRVIPYEYMGEEDNRRVSGAIDAMIRQNAPYDIQYTLHLPNGKTVFIHAQGKVHYDAEGKPAVVTVSIQDITEQMLEELELRRVKESLKEAQRLAHIGSWDWEIATGKLYWSDESYRLMGLEPSSAPARSGMLLEYVVPDDKDRVAAALDRALKNSEPLDMEYCIHTADGKMEYIHSRGQVQYDAAGQPVYMAGTMQDITERKLAELEIRRSKESLEEAQRIGHIGSWEWNITENEYYWSDEICNIFGVNRQEMAAGTGHGYSYLSPEDGRKFEEALSNAFETGGSYDVEIGIVRPDGQTRYVHGIGAAKTNAEGLAVSVRGISQDITERKLQEKALRQLNESYRLILDSTNDGIVMYDRDGKILNINKAFAERFSISAEDMIGLTRHQVLHDDFYADLYSKRLEKLQRVFDTGEPLVWEDSRNGAWFDNRYYPVYRDGTVTAVTLFSTDITSKKFAEEEAGRRAESETRLTVMTEFFTNVSHELKTPLSLILMQMDMMRMYVGDPAKMQGYLADATLNAFRLTRLVSNLLDITKMDAGFLKLNLRNKDIVSILKNIGESVAVYATARKISLGFTSNAGSKMMDLDSDKIERVILNLLSNAIKHTPEGGKIILDFKDRQDSVKICVTDTGEGIPADKLDAVFDRFVQVNNALSRQTEGCGIGLALVKSMVELHHGDVWVESEPGQSTTFTVVLPVKNTDTQEKVALIDGFDLHKKVKMELSDLYIKVDA